MNIVELNSSNSWKNELKDWVTRKKAPASPVEFAIRASNGFYKPGRHHWFLNDYLLKVTSGEIDRLLMCLPPGHGKSMLTSEFFPAWYIGTHPDEPIILTSYEADLARSWGRKSRALIREFGSSLFPNVIELKKDTNAADWWEIQGHRGGMSTAGAGGAITGKRAKILVIDDPHKNDKEASSQVMQESIFNWYESTCKSRLKPNGAIILIQTRWHTQDLAGRILESEGDQWTIISLPAIAEENDILDRKPGEALWPEYYPLSELEKIMPKNPHLRSALFQQCPYDEEGGMFPPEKFEFVDSAPIGCTYVRGWDFAATEDGGDYCGGVLFGYKNGLYYITDAIEFRKDGDGVLENTKKVAEDDGHRVRIRWEQEKASAGKILSASLKKTIFKGFNAEGVPPSGSKIVRATPFSNAVKAGLVKIVRGEWNRRYLEQLKLFPYGKNDDLVDGSAYAFNDLESGISEPGVVARSKPFSKYQEGGNNWNKYR